MKFQLHKDSLSRVRDRRNYWQRFEQIDWHRTPRGEWVECPQCKHRFDSHETFWWGADWNGDPTVENIYCPKCPASTAPHDKRRRQWNIDDFKVVQSLSGQPQQEAPRPPGGQQNKNRKITK